MIIDYEVIPIRAIVNHREVNISQRDGNVYAPQHAKMSLWTFANSVDTDQPAHLRRLIWVYAVSESPTVYDLRFPLKGEENILDASQKYSRRFWRTAYTLIRLRGCAG